MSALSPLYHRMEHTYFWKIWIMNTSQSMSTCSDSMLEIRMTQQWKVKAYVKAMVSLWLKPADVNCASVVSRSVVGSGTPDGPASVASILPTRRGIPVSDPPQVETDATRPWNLLADIYISQGHLGTYQCNVVGHTQVSRYCLSHISRAKGIGNLRRRILRETWIVTCRWRRIQHFQPGRSRSQWKHRALCNLSQWSIFL